MKVVALRSFFGAGIDAKKGMPLDVSDKLGKAWEKAGLVRKATADDKEPAKATTSPTPAPATPPAPSEPTEPTEPETTGEVVTEPETPTADQTDGEADKEPTQTGTETEPTEPTTPVAPTEPTEPQAPTAPVAPQHNSKNNGKKAGK